MRLSLSFFVCMTDSASFSSSFKCSWPLHSCGQFFVPTLVQELIVGSFRGTPYFSWPRFFGRFLCFFRDLFSVSRPDELGIIVGVSVRQFFFVPFFKMALFIGVGGPSPFFPSSGFFFLEVSSFQGDDLAPGFAPGPWRACEWRSLSSEVTTSFPARLG